MFEELGVLTEIHLESITFCKYKLRIGEKNMLLSFPQLLALRNQVHQLTEPSVIEDTINSSNYNLLFIGDRAHLVLLDVHQLINLKWEVDSFFYQVNPVLI